MIGFRSFRNGDTPWLAEIWRTRAGSRGYVQPMTSGILERFVLAKPYFERAGLIVATDDERPIGFAHAGFGPSDDGNALDRELGATLMVIVSPHAEEASIAATLIACSEEYLRRGGAKVLYGGGVHPLNAFYVGLYGGSELPGVLASDAQQQAWFRAAGYREIDGVAVLQRDLGNFRPVFDRQQMQLRRRTRVESEFDPPARNWWDSCVWGEVPRLEFRLQAAGEEAPVATLTVVDLEMFSQTWGVRAVGLTRLDVSPDHRRQGLAACLVGEALRQLVEQGVGLVEVQTMQSNTAALALYRKLGFAQVDSGAVFRKEVAG